MQLVFLGQTTAGLWPARVIATHHQVAICLDNDICLTVGGREPPILLQGLPSLQGVRGWGLCGACACSTS